MSIIQGTGGGLGGAGAAGGPLGTFFSHTIDQSLRFNDDDTPRLTRTWGAAATDDTTWTVSMWVKRSSQDGGNWHTLFAEESEAWTVCAFYNDTLYIQINAGGAAHHIQTNRLFRDFSSWYHIVVAFDEDNGTAAHRLRLYVNGVEETSFATDGRSSISSSSNSNWNTNGKSCAIGARSASNNTRNFDGYMAEFHNIDGQQLTPSSFGETKDGVWIPKAYSGSHGDNGFYLPFDDSSAIGDDESANTNDWTVTNLAANDVVPDSPTNNFPNLLPGFTQTTQEGGLKLKRSSTGNIHTGCFSTMGVSSGKWYVEIKYEDSGIDTVTFGVAETKGGFDPTVDSTAYVETSGISNNVDVEFATWSVEARLSSSYAGTLGSAGSYGSSPSSGDIIQIALDMDDQKIWYGVNGTYIASGDPANGTNASQSGSSFNPTGEVVFVASAYMGRDFSISFNFGQDSANVSSANADENGIGTFEYAPPSGFLALCSANLPEPAIGPNSTTQADENFNTLLYTGDNTASRAITGVGFAPDWIWLKARNTASYHHQLHDSVRGASAGALYSSLTNAEDSSYPITSFDSDGFTTKSGVQNGQNTSNTYVAWNWKAGGTAVSNTNGSITSSVSANPDAGFSICTYTGTATVSESFGHGLSQAPELVITKARNTTDNWRVHGSVLGTNKFLSLSGTGAVGTDSSNGGFPDNTDTVVNLGYESTNGTNYVAYCFHSVEGYSKVGSYVGNGSADGTFVYTGHRVKWLMVKNTDNAATSWWIMDTERSTFNVMNDFLFPNLANAESASTVLFADFLSNGFKIRNGTYGETNASGNKYIYLAFGDSFKYANAR